MAIANMSGMEGDGGSFTVSPDTLDLAGRYLVNRFLHLT